MIMPNVLGKNTHLRFCFCIIFGKNFVHVLLFLSLSFPVGGSPPQSVPGSPRGIVDQLRTDVCDELLGTGSRGVAALCWAGEVGDEQQVTVASGHRSLGRCRA